MRDSIEIGRHIACQSPLDKFRGPEIQPAGEPIDEFIKRNARTAHHPLGTCKMGPDNDPMAVVGPELLTRGTENLRVIDASVFLAMIGGNISAPIMMVAERISDIIRGREPLPPIHTAS